MCLAPPKSACGAWAWYMVGIWEISRDHLPENATDGLSLIQKAATKNYGPALYEVAMRQLDGRDLPKESAKGFDTMTGPLSLIGFRAMG